MPVRFIKGLGSAAQFAPYPPGGKFDKLYDKKFPADDVEAYWSMVPDQVIVEWSAALGIFVVYRVPRHYDEIGEVDEIQPAKRRQVTANDAHKLEVWRAAISDVCGYDKSNF